MIALEQQIYLAVTGDATLRALLGTDGGGNTSFYVDQLIENPVYPAGRFQRISTIPVYTQNYRGNPGQATVGWCRFQFDWWTRGANAANVREAICRAFLNVLDTFNAYALPTSPLVLNQAPSIVLNRRYTVEPNTDPPLFKAMFDVKLYWQDQ